MTHDEQNGKIDEEGAVGRLIDGLNRERDRDPVEELGELLEKTPLRGYLETFGLLGFANEPVAPSAEVKERLLRALEAESPPEEEMRRAPGAFGWQAPRDQRSRAGARPGWPLKLAATFALGLLGLSAWQLTQLHRQDRAISRLEAQLLETEQRSQELADLRGQLANARAKLALVTSPAVEVCTLRPNSENSLHPDSRGTLWVAADHQHWYLNVDGLGPSPRDKSYQLWFLTPEGAVSAGTFDVEAGAPWDLTSETMPAGTRAVLITVEPLGGSPRPSGPSVLYGDEVMRIL